MPLRSKGKCEAVTMMAPSHFRSTVVMNIAGVVHRPQSSTLTCAAPRPSSAPPTSSPCDSRGSCPTATVSASLPVCSRKNAANWNAALRAVSRSKLMPFPMSTATPRRSLPLTSFKCFCILSLHHLKNGRRRRSPRGSSCRARPSPPARRCRTRSSRASPRARPAPCPRARRCCRARNAGRWGRP